MRISWFENPIFSPVYRGASKVLFVGISVLVIAACQRSVPEIAMNEADVKQPVSHLCEAGGFIITEMGKIRCTTGQAEQ